MSVKLAVEGCCHGSLDAIYRSLMGLDVELLLICGDFQAIRNSTDLQTLSVPNKYLQMGDFFKYYLGEKKAPVLTLFVGGNHECSLYLRELQYGGWVAPNIYYLGEFGVVWYRGLRISGISGIWNSRSFSEAISSKPPRYSLPYLDHTLKSIYHVKPKNHLKLLLSGPSDIVMGHDWPQWVWQWGDSKQLLRHKPFFQDDMKSGRLGSPLAAEALSHLKPRYWFSLHLHTRFTACVKHLKPSKKAKIAPSKNPDEVSLDMDDFDSSPKTSSEQKSTLSTDSKLELKDGNTESVSQSSPTVISLDMDADETQQEELEVPASRKRTVDFSPQTEFLALDKCLPRKRFLEFMDIDTEGPNDDSTALYHDARALAIQKVVEDFVTSNPRVLTDLGPGALMKAEKIRNLLSELDDSIAYEEKKLKDKDLEIPMNFQVIAPVHSESKIALQYWESNQTNEMCDKFKIPKPNLLGP